MLDDSSMTNRPRHYGHVRWSIAHYERYVILRGNCHQSIGEVQMDTFSLTLWG